MDFIKAVDFLQQYPIWFRNLLSLWLVGGALIAGGLLALRSTETKPASVVPAASVPATPAGPAVATLNRDSDAGHDMANKIASSPDEYARRLRKLSGRFMERQEFVDIHQGAVVEWDGVVEQVLQHTESKRLSLTFRSAEAETTVLALLPDSLRTKAFSLHPGDIVRVRGTLGLSTPSMPDLTATELLLVKPSGGG